MLSKFLSLIVLVLFAAGCGVQAQTYVMTKERADIAPSGNAGSLMGKNEYQEPQKKTRKVYILEVSKPVAETEVKKIKQEIVSSKQEVRTEEAPVGDVNELLGDDLKNSESTESASAPVAAVAEGPKETLTYTVLKDDTLQKIAKKFYNSYGKWIKIYEANKEKIKNPNFVRPGTVLTIPAVE